MTTTILARLVLAMVVGDGIRPVVSKLLGGPRAVPARPALRDGPATYYHAMSTARLCVDKVYGHCPTATVRTCSGSLALCAQRPVSDGHTAETLGAGSAR